MGLNERQQENADRIREDPPDDIPRLDVDEEGFLVVQESPDACGPACHVTLERHVDGPESESDTS